MAPDLAVSVPEQYRRLAAELLDRPLADILAVTAAACGANSRVYRVTTTAGRVALKIYPDRAGDPRRRAEAEWAALSLMREIGLSAAPAPIARSGEANAIVLEWIDGEPVDCHSARDLRAALDFIVELFKVSTERPVTAPLASEACLSVDDILAQIEARRRALIDHPDLDRFFAASFDPVLAAASAQALSDEHDPSAQLAPEKRRLTPSDFGFHNALREANGRLRFIDFDYFGWDDPAKFATDLLLHPATTFSDEDAAKIVTSLAKVSDPGFAVRLRSRFRLFALRWALILLNVMRADRQTTPLAEGSVALGTRFQTQIAKARVMCRRRWPLS